MYSRRCGNVISQSIYNELGSANPQNFHVNARIKTADTAPRFHGWTIIAASFRKWVYEWYADGITKQPYYIKPKDREISLIAGICTHALGREIRELASS